MEDSPGPNLPELMPVIKEAEVFVFAFRNVGRHLLVDTRSTKADPPIFQFVSRVRFFDQRYRDLARQRPYLPMPKEILPLEWPHSIRTLVQTGLWQALQERVVALGVAESVCVKALTVLQSDEREEEMKALRGEQPYRTLGRRLY